MRQNQWRRILLGFVISILALGAVFYIADYRQVWNALQQGNYVLFLPLAVASQLLSFIFRSFAWQTLLKKKVGVKKLFFTINVGYLVNNIFPFRAGEVARALLLSRSGLVSFWEAASTILIERAFDVLISVSILLSSLPFVFALKSRGDAAWALPAAAFSGGVVLLGIFLLHVVARNRERLLAWMSQLGQRWKLLARFSVGRMESFLNGLSVLTDGRSFFTLLGWMLLSWAANLAVIYTVLSIFIEPVSLLWAAFSMGVVSIGIIVPSSPGSIGVVEAAYMGGLAVFNVDSAKALAFALVARAIYTIITTILGVYGLAQEGETLSQLYQNVTQRKG